MLTSSQSVHDMSLLGHVQHGSQAGMNERVGIVMVTHNSNVESSTSGIMTYIGYS